MKLTLERDALQGALQRVGKCVGKGSPHPILGNVLLRTEGDGLVLHGTDLDMVASAKAAASIETEGAVTVPAKMFQDIVARSPSGAQMRIETGTGQNGETLTLRTGRARIAMQTLPARDFPDMPADDLTHRFEVDAKGFARLLDKVDFAIMRDETRVYLAGVFLHPWPGSGVAENLKLRAVATDTHRMAVYEIPLPAGAETMPGIIVPRKAVAELIRLGKETPGVVTIGTNGGKIVADYADGTRLVSKLIDGTYPDYARVIPRNEKHATLDRDAVAEATARLAAVAGGEGSIKFSFSRDMLQLAVFNTDAGESVDEIETDWSVGDLQIGFAASYVRDTLGAFSECDQIIGMFSDPGAPAVFMPKNDPSLTLLIMPRRV